MTQTNTPVSYVGKHVFTQEEKDSKLQQMLTAMRIKQEIEDELKTTKSTYKAKIDSRDAEIKLMSNLLNAGQEDRTFQCILFKDFESGKRFYIEVGTNKTIGEELLTAADYQTQMDLDEAKIKANNEIEIGGEDSAFRTVLVSEIPFEEETPAVEPEVIDKPIKQKEVKTKTVKIDPKSQIEESSFGALSDEFRDEESDPFNFGDDI